MENEISRIEREIAETKAHLRELYAQRKEIKSSIPRKVSSDERKKQVFDLASTGKTLEEIAGALGIKPQTVKDYLWKAILWRAHEELLEDGKATVVRPNEHGGESWTVSQDDLTTRMRDINARLAHRLSEKMIR